ncbi:ribonuclease T2-like protein [Syncephalis fuscata]|nr:ribonuclease T2-like protein [Syncephalis fuscata]
MMTLSTLKTLLVVSAISALVGCPSALARVAKNTGSDIPIVPSNGITASASLAGGLTCPLELSCSAKKNANSCCSPTMGLMVFTQQWYPSLGPSDQFTMHGLWPDNCDGTYGPSDGCDSERNYDNLGQIIEEGDAELFKNMNTYWPSYKGDAPAFWSHEWNKHGTCVSTLEPKRTEYFRTALSLRAGIVPGNKYDSEAFAKALQNAWGVPVGLKCSRDGIQEIQVWLKVKGRDQFIAVSPPSKGSSSSCGRLIAYPTKNGSDTRR